MTTRIRFRRDTAANWTSANPTLASGEAGFETDTSKFKAGDGTTAWNSLDYVFGDVYSDIATIQGDITTIDGEITALQALPIATRVAGDSTDITATTTSRRICSMRTAVGLTTVSLSANTVYAVYYEPTADELMGRSVIDKIEFEVTALGDLCHIGIWLVQDGYPLTLVADSGAIASTTGIVQWSPSFVPDPDKLYVFGIVVNTSTTVRAVSQNACAGLGLPSTFGSTAQTHFECSMTYGSLSDFNTPTMGTGPIPAIGTTYAAP